jgi:choline monooxygenase
VNLSEEEFESVARGYDPVATRSFSINKNCYRDPRFLEVEREQIFRKSWQYLCHESKLSEPGSYIATDVQGQSIFAARDVAGTLRAFYNVCRHRGHELLKGDGNTRFITCPYHARVYNLYGTLRRARRSELIENFNIGDICLGAVRVEIFCHLVFVNLDLDSVPLAEQSGDLRNEVMCYAPDLARLKLAHRLTYRIQANWKVIVDNFLECYHCPVAHKDFVSLVDMNTYKVTAHDRYSSHIAKAGQSTNSAYAVDGASVTDHAVWHLWPNIALLRYPGRGNFMVWRFIPVGPEETLEEFDFFYESDSPSEMEMEAIRYIDTVLQPEDIGLVESVQRGMRTPAFEQGRYMVDPAESGLSEHAVHRFHGLILDAYREACVQ